MLANPIFRKWLLLMADLLIVLFSISIATFVLYLKSVFILKNIILMLMHFCGYIIPQ